MATTSSSGDRDPVDRLAEEFLERKRRGDRPSITEYCQRYPQWADRIEGAFLAAEVMERLKPGSGVETGSFHGESSGPGSPRPEQLGDYRILREVGRGGMGVVYEAVQESLGRHVALKVLPLHGRISSVQMERFRLEARSAARLHHTHIVPVYGVGEHCGAHYYAMQFIHGCGLDSVINDLRRLRPGAAAGGPPPGSDPEPAGKTTVTDATRSRAAAELLLTGGAARPGAGATATGPPPDGPLAPPTSTPPRPADGSGLSERSEPGYFRSVARIGVQVAEALAHAHGQGILHRDIKPSNLLLDADGEVWVTDFGLAKVEGGDGLTRTGDIVGTLRYMAPERFDGWSDPRSDVYGLGMTLYELLTLRPAHEAPTRARLIERVLHEPPAPPRKVNPTVPRDLETVVLKAIAKEPAERYPTAKTLAEDLANFLVGKPIRARRVGPLERAWRWCRRNPMAAAFLAVSGFAMLTLVGLGVALGYQLRLRTAYAEKDAALARELTFKYQNNVIAAERELNDNNPQRAEELLDDCPEGRRDWEWNYLKRQCHAELMTIECHQGGDVRSLAMSPDGRLLATGGSQHGSVKLWQIDRGETLRTLSEHDTDEGVWCAFSPGGTRIASVSGSVNRTNYLLVHRVATGEVDLNVPVSTCRWATLAFSPDGREIAVASGVTGARANANNGGAGWLKSFDAETGRELHSFETDGQDAFLPSFHPDGKSLVAVVGPWTNDDTSGRPNEIRIWDARTGEVRRKIPAVDRRLFVSACYSPDGLAIATCGFDTTLRLWDAQDGHEISAFRGHRNCTNSVAFSPDGHRIASTSDDGSARVWDTQTGKCLITLRGHRGAFNPVVFSPDGRRLVTGGTDDTARVWDATAGPEALTIPASRSSVRALAFSPDGRRLVTGDFDGVLKLWELPSGRLLDPWRGHSQPVLDVTFNRHGTRVASAAGNWMSKADQLGEVHIRDATTDWMSKADQLGEVHIRDATTGRLLHEWRAHRKVAWHVRFSPDDRWLASSGGEISELGQEIILWDLANDTRRTIPVPEGGVWGLAVSRDGRRISGGMRNVIRTWDAETGESYPRIEQPSVDTASLDYSPDGRTLFSTTSTGILGVWDVVTGRSLTLRTLRSDNFLTSGVAVNPAGTRVATVGTDHTVKLWDTTTYRLLITLRGHALDDRGIYGVAFSPDGRWIASSDDSGVVKLWDGSPFTGGAR
jgi:WD40 repeat protein/serine/threonine protein kinase